MTREEAIYELDRMKTWSKELSDEEIEAIAIAIKVLDQEPCGDAISRQAAIDACLNGWNKDYKKIVEEIRTLPPVKPQPKMEVNNDIL